jgi:hypothetical protein
MELTKINSNQYNKIVFHLNKLNSCYKNIISPKNEQDQKLIYEIKEVFSLIKLRFNGVEIYNEFDNYKEATCALKTLSKLNKKEINKILTLNAKYENLFISEYDGLMLKPDSKDFRDSLFVFDLPEYDEQYTMTVKQFLDLFIEFLINNRNELTYPKLEDVIVKLRKLYWEIFNVEFEKR